jgi:hypothetical protein
MSNTYARLGPITLEAAEQEPEHERLDFTRRPPSPATAAALRRAARPELLAEDVARIKAGRRPGAV